MGWVKLAQCDGQRQDTENEQEMGKAWESLRLQAYQLRPLGCMDFLVWISPPGFRHPGCRRLRWPSRMMRFRALKMQTGTTSASHGVMWCFSINSSSSSGPKSGSTRPSSPASKVGAVALARDADHLVIVGPAPFDIGEEIVVSVGIQPALRHHAPRAPGFHVELEVHRSGGIADPGCGQAPFIGVCLSWVRRLASFHLSVWFFTRIALNFFDSSGSRPRLPSPS